MKKLFTLTLMLLGIALTTNAQNHRKWDFTNWSAATIDNLSTEATKGATGGSWSDIEKANGTTPGNNVCFWSYADNIDGDGNLTANGKVIAETEGLKFNAAYSNRRSLALAVNYPSTTLGDYAGGQYLWLGGGNAKNASARILCFTIPKVAVGQKITFVVESHKPSDARGVSLFVSSVTDDANQIGESFKPKTQDTYTWEGWTLPDGVSANADGTVDILVYNTNGCHIYSIEVGDNNNNSKIAYLYTGDADAEAPLAALQSREGSQVTAIDVATQTVTADDLQQYDVTVVAPSVPADNAAVQVVKEAMPFTPVLNLNNSLYAVWGYGRAATAVEGLGVVKNENSKLFKNVNVQTDDTDETFKFIALAEGIPGVRLGKYFAADQVLLTEYVADMTVEPAVIAHAHNLDHNGYIYLPWIAADDMATLLNNAVTMLSDSKSKVTAAVKPTFSFDYKNMQTVVTISSSQKNAAIYYTIDGSEPTTDSTPYTEPFTISEQGVTVKAVAIAEGYLLSETAAAEVTLKQQAVAPEISIAQEAGQTTVTISGTGDIWYNFTGASDTKKSAKYEAPIVLTYPRTIYAFTTGEGLVNSEITSQQVDIEGFTPRTNILSHMDANAADYNGGSTSTAYYFSWAKDKAKYPYYVIDSRSETAGEPDPETGDETTIVTYSQLSPEEEKDFGTGWAIRSRGEIVDWENLSTGENYGDNSDYNFATVEDNNADFPATKGIINLADKNTTPSDVTSPFPYNAYIVSTQKFKGPFNVVVNAGSIVKPAEGTTTSHKFLLQVATDQNNAEGTWTVLGDTIKMEGLNRLTKNIIRSYEGSEEVYVRVILTDGNSKVGFYDIYVANNPEEITTAISNVADRQQPTDGQAAFYTLSGLRIDKPARGLYIRNGRKVVVR